MLRNKADRLTLTFMVIMTTLLFINWQFASIHPIWYLLLIVMTMPVFAIAHNHVHLPIFKSKILNRLMCYWITCFYGYPIFAWVPTHVWNHHKYNNKQGDIMATYRYSEKNNMLNLLTYPLISIYHQQKSIYNYLNILWKIRRNEFYFCLSQYFILALAFLTACLINWKKAVLYMLIPQQIILYMILVINYIYHVHADEESEYNHSRNFTGAIINLLWLNSGYHTVHHNNMTLHWSDCPAAHAKIENKIHPDLIEKNIIWYLIRVYLFSPFSRRFQTQSLRLLR